MAERLVRYIVTDPEEEEAANIIMDTKMMLQQKANEMIRHETEYRKAILMRNMMMSLVAHLTNSLYHETVKHLASMPAEQTVLVHTVAEFYKLAKQAESLKFVGPQVDVVAALVVALFKSEKERQYNGPLLFDVTSHLAIAYYQLYVQHEREKHRSQADIINTLTIHAYETEKRLQVAQPEVLMTMVSHLVIQLFLLAKQIQQVSPDLSGVVTELTIALYEAHKSKHDDMQGGLNIAAMLCVALFRTQFELNKMKAEWVPPDVMNTLVTTLYSELKKNKSVCSTEVADLVNQLVVGLYKSETEKQKQAANIMTFVCEMTVALYKAEKRLAAREAVPSDIVVSLVISLFKQSRAMQKVRGILETINSLHDEHWGIEPKTLKIVVVDEKEVIDNYIRDVYTNKAQFPQPGGLPGRIPGAGPSSVSGNLGDEVDTLLHNVTQLIQRQTVQSISPSASHQTGSVPVVYAQTPTTASAKIGDFSGPPLLSQLQQLQTDLQQEKLKGTQQDIKTIQNLRTRYERLKNEQQKLMGGVMSLGEEASELSNFQSLQAANTALDAQISQEEARLANQKIQYQKLKTLLSGLDPKSQVRTLQNSIKTKRAQLAAREAQANRLRSDIEKLQETQSELGDIDDKQEELESVNKKIEFLNDPTNPDGISALRTKLAQLKSERPKGQVPLSVLKQQIKQKEKEWTDLDKKLTKLKDDLKKEEGIKDDAKETERMQSEADEVRKKVTDIEREIAEKGRSLEVLKEKNHKAATENAATKSALESQLNQLKAEYATKTRENMKLVESLQKARREGSTTTVMKSGDAGKMIKIPSRTEREIDVNEKEISKLDDETLELQRQLTNARLSHPSVTSTIASAENARDRKKASEQRLADARKLNQDVKNEIEILKTQQEEAENNGGDLLNTLKKQEQEILDDNDRIEAESARLQVELEGVKDAIAKAETSFNSREMSMKIAKESLMSKLEDLKKKKADKLRELHGLKMEHSSLFEKLGISLDSDQGLESPLTSETVDAISDYVTEKLKDYRQELRLDEVIAERSRLEGEIEVLGARNAALVNSLKVLSSKKAEIEDESAQVESDLSEMAQRAETLQTTARTLKSKERIQSQEEGLNEEEEEIEEIDFGNAKLVRDMAKAGLESQNEPVDLLSPEGIDGVKTKMDRIIYIFQKGFPVLDTFIDTLLEIVEQLDRLWGDTGINVTEVRKKWASPDAQSMDFAEDVYAFMAYLRRALVIKEENLVNQFLADLYHRDATEDVMKAVVNFLIAQHVIYRSGLDPNFLQFYDQTYSDRWITAKMDLSEPGKIVFKNSGVESREAIRSNLSTREDRGSGEI